MMDVETLACRLKPSTGYPQDSVFGRRVRHSENSKRRVASYIALKLLQGCQEVFIADGTSGLWIMLAILELGLLEDQNQSLRNLRVLTNNAAIVMERVLRHNSQVEVIVAKGRCNSEYAGIFGKAAEKFCAEAAKNAQLTIMPVTGLTFERGPCAGDPDARRIKQAVMPEARELVLISDVYKMGSGRNDTSPVFRGTGSEIWHKVRSSGCVHVVCDRPQGVENGQPALWDPDHWAPISASPTPEQEGDFRNLQAFGREAAAFSRALGGRLHLVPNPE